MKDYRMKDYQHGIKMGLRIAMLDAAEILRSLRDHHDEIAESMESRSDRVKAMDVPGMKAGLRKRIGL